MPANKFHVAKLTFVISAALTPQIRKAMKSWSCLSVSHFSDIYILPIKVLHMASSQVATSFTVLCCDWSSCQHQEVVGTPMHKQKRTFDRPFCQTAILRGRSCSIFVWILLVDRPLYLSLCRINPSSFPPPEFVICKRQQLVVGNIEDGNK